MRRTALLLVASRFVARTSCLGAAMALVVAGVPLATADVRGPLVIMMKAPIQREGSLEDCIYRQVVGGKSLSDAIRECATLQPPAKETGGLPMHDLLDRGGRDVAVAACATFSNPKAEGHSPAWPEAKAHAMAWQLGVAHLDAFIVDFLREKDPELRTEILKTLLKIHENNNAHGDAYRKLKPELTAAEQAELHAFLAAFGDADQEKHPPGKPPTEGPGDFPPPDPEGPTVARPLPDTQSLCELVGEAVGECNRDGWRSPYCRELKRRLDHCADPKVADPEPGADTCLTPTVDPEKVQEVILLRCTAKKKPVPGEDPCKPLPFTGLARTFGLGPANPEGCNDPRVRTTGETCLPTITLIEFEEPDARNLLKKMFKKLGGPIFVVPVNDPHPLPPTPIDIPK